MNPIFLSFAPAAALCVLLARFARRRTPPPPSPACAVSPPEPATPEQVTKTGAEWRAQLTPEQFHVTREKGTELARTGKYWNTFEDGTYRCVCCGAVLFRSEDKYDSWCGWPAFGKTAPGSGITETH